MQIQKSITQNRHAGKRMIAVCGLVVFACFIGVAIGVATIWPDSERFPLVVDTKYRDFGEVWEQDAFSWEIPIRNISNREVNVNRFASSCRCAAVEPNAFSIKPGETKRVNLTLNLRSPEIIKKRLSMDAWPFQTRFAARADNVRVRPPVWTVQGRVKPTLRFTPDIVNFEHTLVQGEPFYSQKASVKVFDEKVSGLDLDYDKNTVSVEVIRNNAESDAGPFQLVVTPNETLPVGRFDIEILVSPKLPNGEQLPAAPLVCTGIILSNVFAMPNQLFFPPIDSATNENANQSVYREIVVQTRTRRSFAVEEIISPNNRVFVNPTASRPATEHVLRVSSRLKKEDFENLDPLKIVVVTNEGKREIIEVHLGMEAYNAASYATNNTNE